MNRLQEDIRHEIERGVMLLVLINNDLDPMPLKQLMRQMVAQGFLKDVEDIRFHVNYCEQSGYLERKSLRAGRTDIELETVRATKKAVDLYDGRIPADPGIVF